MYNNNLKNEIISHNSQIIYFFTAKTLIYDSISIEANKVCVMYVA